MRRITSRLIIIICCLLHQGMLTTGSVQATDRLLKELREIYRSDNFKHGEYLVCQPVACMISMLALDILILLSCVQVHKYHYQLIQYIKYTETIEHQRLEALTGVPIQQSYRYCT